jgi:hypothetical protein
VASGQLPSDHCRTSRPGVRISMSPPRHERIMPRSGALRHGVLVISGGFGAVRHAAQRG